MNTSLGKYIQLSFLLLSVLVFRSSILVADDHPSSILTMPTSITWVHLSTANGDIPPPNQGGFEQTACLVLDIDKDGINDFVIAERRSMPSVVWYRRQANGWDKYTIDNARLDIEAGGAFHDIDGDGDLDIVFGGDDQSNAIWWWENPYPNFDPDVPWTRRLIKNSGSTKHHDQIFGDFTGDGNVELITWNQNAKKLLMASIPTDPRTSGVWNFTEIYSWNSGQQLEGFAATDIDLDGKLDLVGGGRWFKHNGGTDFTAHIIDDTQRFTRVAVGQLIPGGRPEVVFNSGDAIGPLAWYEWQDSVWVGHDLLGVASRHGHTLQIEDIDGDGHLDIFAAEMALHGTTDCKMWIFFGDGTGNFTQVEISSGIDNHESRLADLDGDGDLDIIGKPYNFGVPGIHVWLQNGTNPTVLPITFWQKHIIDYSKPHRVTFTEVADLDGDGFKDIVMGSWWYKNPGTITGEWSLHLIGAPLNNVALVYDFDGDGDLDILGTQGIGDAHNGAFAWAENDGSGNFTIHTNIESGPGPFLQGVTTAQFQEGGPLEIVLSWNNSNGGTQFLTVPEEPVNQLWTLRQISPVTQGEGIDIGDIDSDGDLDILLGTQWLRNDGASWTPFTMFNPTVGEPDRSLLVDMNGDGHLDAVVGYGHDPSGKLVWLENPGDPTQPWTEHIIGLFPEPGIAIHGIQSISVVDIDRDGDWDIVAGEHNNPVVGGERLWIFENVDGVGGSWATHTIDAGEEHHMGAIAIDIDNDGDLDIVTTGWINQRVIIYENKALDGGMLNTPPFITRQPSPQAVIEGQSATFVVENGGSVPLQYQWQKNGVDIPGATASTYTTPATILTDSGSVYRCIVTNFYGSMNSAQVPLIVSRYDQRVSAGLQVLYTFDEGGGTTVNDVSGVGSPLTLSIPAGAGVTWIPGGLIVHAATTITSSGPATKLISAIKSTNEITIEAWVRPASTEQNGPARIVTVSSGLSSRNVTLGQGVYNVSSTRYDVRLKTSATDPNGIPSVSTPDGIVVTGLTHIVYTRATNGTVKIYVDGIEQSVGTVPGTLASWVDSYQLALGNETTGERPWLGEYNLVALYNRALSHAEISHNLALGPGGEGAQDRRVAVNIRAMLEGALDPVEGLMNEDLAAVLPLSHPYGVGPWSHVGPESVETIPPGVVDWVLIELRTDAGGDGHTATRAAFIRSDGQVVDLDGVSMPMVEDVPPGSYHVVLRHRNHLAVMSAAPLTLAQTSELYDFTTDQAKAYGTNPMKAFGSSFALVAGDVDGNGGIGASDLVMVRSFIGSTTYSMADIDMNGGVGASDLIMVRSAIGQISHVP